jgi:hypothetical protein
MNLFPSSLFTWNKHLKTAAVYLSEMNGQGYNLTIPGICVKILSSRTGKVKPFTFSKIDYADPSHEDVAGYRYSANIGGEKWEVIFIND